MKRTIFMAVVLFLLASQALIASCTWSTEKSTDSVVSDVVKGQPSRDGANNLTRLQNLRGADLLACLRELKPTELPEGVTHLPCSTPGIDLDDIAGSSDVLSGRAPHNAKAKSEQIPDPNTSEDYAYKTDSLRDGTLVTLRTYPPDHRKRIRLDELGYNSDKEFFSAITAELDLIDRQLELSDKAVKWQQSEYDRAWIELRAFYWSGKELPDGWPVSPEFHN